MQLAVQNQQFLGWIAVFFCTAVAFISTTEPCFTYSMLGMFVGMLRMHKYSVRWKQIKCSNQGLYLKCFQSFKAYSTSSSGVTKYGHEQQLYRKYFFFTFFLPWHARGHGRRWGEVHLEICSAFPDSLVCATTQRGSFWSNSFRCQSPVSFRSQCGGPLFRNVQLKRCAVVWFLDVFLVLLESFREFLCFADVICRALHRRSFENACALFIAASVV